MNHESIEQLDRRNKILLLLASLATIALLVASALRENTYAEWRQTRLEYSRILESKAEDARGRSIAEQFSIGIDQIVLPELETRERCVTCHVGLEDPRMTEVALPFRTHPGNHLALHPPERFGCTVCHQGQPLATESTEAHGRIPHWPKPMFESRFLYSSCVQCHDRSAVLESAGEAAAEESSVASVGARLLARGELIFETTGCQGCHIVDGNGGTLGPDISFVGDKSIHDFDFSHFPRDGPRTISAWLERHFLEPDEISPGTIMPDMNLNQEDAAALTAFVLSLRSRDVPPSFVPLGKPTAEEIEESLSGEQIYLKMCSACHGADGRSSDVPGIRTPALNNPDSLAVSSDDYYRFIIENGRSGTSMPSWGKDAGALSRDQIDLIVEHIRGWEAPGADPALVRARSGNPAMGKAYYRGLCANCHGVKGKGGLGNALNVPGFLSIASDEFIARTIIRGRPGTAMASWKHLPEQTVSDLLAYIRSWESTPPPFEEVNAALSNVPRETLLNEGKILFRGNCATCHGSEGEGSIGPRLISPGVVPAVDDRFLYRTITEGRPETSMPAWRGFDTQQVASLVTFLRDGTDYERLELPDPPPRGDYDLGQVLFATSCSQCHGVQGEGGVGPQLVNDAFLSAVSDRTLYHWISRGRIGTAMRGFHPEEEGPTTLAPAHVADVIAYIRHIGGRSDRAIKQTGEGDSRLGRDIYRAQCGSCHGMEGEGASGPQLRNSEFLDSASDGFLVATIVLGRTGTPMQSMIHGQEGLGQIEPERIRDVVSYMRTWDHDQSWAEPRSITEMSKRSIDAGSANYARYCAGCHGLEGRGVAEGEDYFAPALNNPEFLAAASDGYLIATIARGRSRDTHETLRRGYRRYRSSR